MRNNKGITMTSLIVTIIVMIILAGIALLFSVGDSGVISRTEKTKFLEDMKLYKEELELYKAEKQIENQKLGVTPITTGLDINEWDYEDIVENKYIPSMNEKYDGKIGILGGELAYMKAVMKDEEEKMAIAAGLIPYDEIARITVEIEGEGTVKIDGEGLPEDGKISSDVETTISLEATAGQKQVGDKTIQYTFAGWYEKGELVEKEAEYNFTVQSDRNLVAKFTTNASLIYYLENGEEKVVLDENTTLSGYKGRTDITKVEFGNGCTTIDSNAFNGCEKLKIEKIPKWVTNIRSSAFAGCTSLTRIEISNARCAGNVFGNCTGLEEVIIGEKGNPMTYTIDPTAFSGCIQTGLTIKVYLPSGTTSIESMPWGATHATVEYYDAMTGELVNLRIGMKYQGNKEINWTNIPNEDKLTEIESSAFKGCTNLALTRLPENINIIDSSTFNGCEKLKIEKIPKKVINIRASAFAGCTSLTRIEIPNARCAGSVFENCTGLQEVIIGEIGNPMTKTIDPTAFSGCTQTGLTIKVYLPSGTTSLANAPWGATNATVVYLDSTTGEELK